MKMQALLQNIRQGTRCAMFRRVDLAQVNTSVEQLVLLIFLEVTLTFIASYITAFPQPTFHSFGIIVEGFAITLTLFGAVLAIWILGRRDRLSLLCTLIFATSPVMILVGYSLTAFYAYSDDAISTFIVSSFSIVTLLYIIWVVAVQLRILALTQGNYSLRVLASTLAFLLVVLPPLIYFDDQNSMWYSNAENASENDKWAAYREIDVESLFYAQRPLLEKSLGMLEPGEKGKADIYYLGFAGYAQEKVFRNEVQFGQELFDHRFGTSNRSISLINHLETREHIPLATASNLRLALRQLGHLMDVDEDILVLYLSSHGSETHELAADFWPLPLNDLTPEMLKEYLDEAGIKWRVIMVSSCFSGGFVPPLENDNTLIATASAPNRSSFGCDDKRDFTYFGEALLRDQLPYRFSLVSSIETAIQSINEREILEKRDPSNPQLSVGDDIALKLEQLERSLSVASCKPETMEC